MKSVQLRPKLPGWSKTGMTAVILCCLQQMNSHLKHIFYAFPGVCLVLPGVYRLGYLKIITNRNSVTSASTIEKPMPVFSDTAARGEVIFTKHCNTCHAVFKNHSEMFLAAIGNNHWSDRKELFRWLQDPVYYMKNEPYGKTLFERFRSMCLQPTPRLNWIEMEEVIAYLHYCREKLLNSLYISFYRTSCISTSRL